MKNDLINPQP